MSTSGITVVTFDLDNTLWDVEPTLLRAEEAQRQWLLQHRPGAIDDIDHAALWEMKKSVYKRHPELAHQISELRRRALYELQIAAGFSEAEAQSGAASAFEAFIAVRHQVELYEKALQVIAQLAGNYTLGALTNGNADIYKTDAAEYFDFAFLAEDVNASKPAPDMFHAALALTGASAQQVVHVGDNPRDDIAGAKAAGMHTVWVNLRDAQWPQQEAADAVVTCLSELPGAIARLNKALTGSARG